MASKDLEPALWGTLPKELFAPGVVSSFCCSNQSDSPSFQVLEEHHRFGRLLFQPGT